jgi:hypothetical protein
MFTVLVNRFARNQRGQILYFNIATLPDGWSGAV